VGEGAKRVRIMARPEKRKHDFNRVLPSCVLYGRLRQRLRQN